jgi:hypothetical protein
MYRHRVIILSLLVGGVLFGAMPQTAAFSHADPVQAELVASPEQSTTVRAAGVNKIKASQTTLYDSVTGKRFIPRGANYVRLTEDKDHVAYHSTFEP